MPRRAPRPRFVLAVVAVATAAVGSTAGADDMTQPTVFHLEEATIDAMQAARRGGLVTTERLVRMYLDRIDAHDRSGPRLRALLHVNADAPAQARGLDAAPEALGPLHGIPVVLKDNIDTADMPTTAGALALAGTVPARDASIVRRLRAAGAVILGKGRMTEFAHFVADGMPAGYGSLGGHALNPYDPRALPGGDGRPALTPGGSSTGPAVAVAANMTAVAIGTETAGSILSPASANAVVGIKPTVGVVSRTGLVPLSLDQDTAGPMARTVRDAAIVLGVIAGHDPEDPATDACLVPDRCLDDYARFLDADALDGARILVPPFPASRAMIMEAAIAVLRSKGATVVRRMTPLPAVTVPGTLHYAFKRDLNAYLSARPASTTVRSLADLVAFNAATPGATKYGQNVLIASEALSPDPAGADAATYLLHREAGRVRARRILDAALDGPDGIPGTADDFDALLFSGNSGVATPARAGYPGVTVPGGFVPVTAPAIQPFPSGVTFSGRAFSEPRLIALAYAYEQATKLRRPPASTPPLPGDTVTR